MSGIERKRLNEINFSKFSPQHDHFFKKFLFLVNLILDLILSCLQNQCNAECPTPIKIRTKFSCHEIKRKKKG